MEAPDLPTPLYHITNIDNLAGIIRAGGLCCDAERVRRGFSCVGIAYEDLKQRRAKTFVRDQAGRAGGVLADYVPFYFANRSPMLYAISMGKVEGYAGGQGDVVYLVTTVERAVAGGRPWCLTDGHAIQRVAEFYTDTQRLDKIDWEVIRDSYWADTRDDPDHKRRKQAEFLVHESVPWNWFHRIGVIDHGRSRRVREIIAEATHQPEVTIDPRWYY